MQFAAGVAVFDEHIFFVVKTVRRDESGLSGGGTGARLQLVYFKEKAVFGVIGCDFFGFFWGKGFVIIGGLGGKKDFFTPA